MSAEPVTTTPSVWSQRWAARAWLWGRSSIQSVRQCGRIPLGGSVAVLRYPSGQVVPTGLQRCNSVWACPVCSARIINRRAETLQKVVDGWHAEGNRVGFQTLTLKHLASESLQEVWDRVMKAWARVQAGADWSRFQMRWGVEMPSRGRIKGRIPIVRTVEVTRGRHGWHVHLHLLVFFAGGGESEGRWTAISSEIERRWRLGVERAGGSVGRKGTHAELVSVSGSSTSRVAEYLAKAVFEGSGDGSAIHREMTWAQTKTDQAGRTPWQLLEAAKAGDEKAAALWAAWEAGSRGRRQMWIAGALLDRYGLRDETDAEAAAEADDRTEDVSLSDQAQSPRGVVQGPPELTCWVPTSMWRATSPADLGLAVRELLPEPGALLDAGLWPISRGREPDWATVVVPLRC